MEQPFFDFLSHKFLPGLSNQPLRITEVWYTLYGDWPQMRLGFVCGDLATGKKILRTKPWLDLKQQLLTFVENFRLKIVPARGNFQI